MNTNYLQCPTECIDPPRIDVFTAASCNSNNFYKTGAYGVYVHVFDENEVLQSMRTLSESASQTTNMRMEMTAVCEALESIPEATFAAINIYVNASAIADGMNSWLKRWKQSGWTTEDGELVVNRDLWMRMEKATVNRLVYFNTVKDNPSTTLTSKKAGALAKRTRCNSERSL
ncbi:RNase H family protein [Thioclava kandeliae]|uniref:ribonuclease H n=1 Tax=Thioclava kandeliae TaxID=3070818 RepID=A0ABV1SH26_9RHOB